jgi:MFS family permease
MATMAAPPFVLARTATIASGAAAAKAAIMTAQPLLPTMATRASAAVRGRFGGLPRTFWIVFSGVVANRLGDMVVPFLVFFLGSRGLTTSQTGMVAMALGAGGLAGPALGGWMSDRISHRTALIAGLVATPASLGALFAAPSLPLLAAAAVLLGVTGKIYMPASNALISSVVSPDDRPKAMSLGHWAVNIGTAAAAASAGFLAGHGFGLLFLIDAATCLVFAAIVYFGIPASPRPIRVSGTHGGYGVVVRDRLMVAYTLLVIVGTVVYAMTEFAIPLSVRDNGLPPTVFGLLAVVNAGFVVIGQPILYGPLSRLPRIPVLAAASGLIAVGVAITGLADRPEHYVVATLVWSAGEVATGVVAGGIVADLAPPDARGRYQGAISWGWAVARLIAPALATGLITVGGPAALWWTVLVLGLVGAALIVPLGPAIAQRTGRR